MRLVAKHDLVGYQCPGERPGCRNCAHARTHLAESGAPRMVCAEHYIEVTSGGICPDHRLQCSQSASLQDFLRRQGDLFGNQVPSIPHVGEIPWSLV